MLKRQMLWFQRSATWLIQATRAQIETFLDLTPEQAETLAKVKFPCC